MTLFLTVAVEDSWGESWTFLIRRAAQSADGEVRERGSEGGAAAGLVTIVGHGHAIDRMTRFTFDDGALTVCRTDALVTDAGNGDAADREVGRGDAGDLAAVAGGVVQADDVRHGCRSQDCPGPDWRPGRPAPPASIRRQSMSIQLVLRGGRRR